MDKKAGWMMQATTVFWTTVTAADGREWCVAVLAPTVASTFTTRTCAS
jgi:hypothetical protein